MQWFRRAHGQKGPYKKYGGIQIQPLKDGVTEKKTRNIIYCPK